MAVVRGFVDMSLVCVTVCPMLRPHREIIVKQLLFNSPIEKAIARSAVSHQVEAVYQVAILPIAWRIRSLTIPAGLQTATPKEGTSKYNLKRLE